MRRKRAMPPSRPDLDFYTDHVLRYLANHGDQSALIEVQNPLLVDAITQTIEHCYDAKWYYPRCALLVAAFIRDTGEVIQ